MSEIETAFVMKVLVGAGILFVIGYIGNLLSFSNRFVNALVTAIVFAVIYGALYYFIDQSTLPAEVGAVSQTQWMQMVGISAALVFIIDLVANMLAFNSRFVNALMTAIVFAVLFGGLMYLTGGVPQPTTTAS
ncbi:MAG: hypothetical protein KKB37_06920 [Alphaproteobacteria bacterium]|nr:hypothetical protein [Alphaproteobacteria bacterium]